MPKLTIGGTEISGVMKADVKIIHSTVREPERVPIMQWDVTIGLQNDDTLAKWAMAPESADRFRRCELVINQRDGSAAHTWTLLKAYVHEYRETEFPVEGAASGATDAGNFITLAIRGTLLHPEDYDGENVMTVAPGEAEALPG